jgi:transposase-like protein
VQLHEEQGKSYRAIAEELEIRNVSQVKAWIKKYRNQESLEDKQSRNSNPFLGRTRTKFQSVEEERDYLKAQVEY